MKEQHDNPWARSRRLAGGDKAAAALLFRLHYWMGKTTYTWGDQSGWRCCAANGWSNSPAAWRSIRELWPC